MSDLNKHKLRKTHQVGSFKYDPGKYYTSDDDDIKKEHDRKAEDEAAVLLEEVPLDNASFEDELEAPWNQYAWAEELRLRVSKIQQHITAATAKLLRS